MWEMKLIHIIVLMEDSPSLAMSREILPIAVQELTPFVKRLSPPVKSKAVYKFFSSERLPEGWTCIKTKDGSPQIHLQYSGPAIEEIVPRGTVLDVFICLATSEKEDPDSRRYLYLRNLPMPFLDDKKPAFKKDPYNKLSAWLTLFIRGTEELIVTWKASHEVNGYMTMEGEVKGTELA